MDRRQTSALFPTAVLTLVDDTKALESTIECERLKTSRVLTIGLGENLSEYFRQAFKHLSVPATTSSWNQRNQLESTKISLMTSNGGMSCQLRLKTRGFSKRRHACISGQPLKICFRLKTHYR